jgi:hypothetical protein
MKEIVFKSKAEMLAECNEIGKTFTRWLGHKGWEKHLIEIIDYFYPMTPRACKNLKQLGKYRRDRAKFIIKARLYFGVDEQER